MGAQLESPKSNGATTLMGVPNHGPVMKAGSLGESMAAIPFTPPVQLPSGDPAPRKRKMRGTISPNPSVTIAR